MLLINGQEGTLLSGADRGLHYGDGVFETLAVRAGAPQWWGRHIRRLTAGCVQLGITCPDPQLLYAEAQHVCDACRAMAVLKIIVTRGAGGRGYWPGPLIAPTRIIALYPWPDYAEAFAIDGVRIRVCAMRLGTNRQLAGIKHLNRLEQVMARREWDDADIPEGLMLDGDQNVIEATMSNIFIVQEGVLLTPGLSDCGVAGIMRELVLESAAILRLDIRITRLKLVDVIAAQEVFLCNSVIGIWPVRELDGHCFPVGPLTRRIADYLATLESVC